MIKVIVSAAFVSAFVILAPLAMAQASNFTSYTGDLTNSTAMIVWTGKYCNLKFNSIEPAKSAYIAKDGDQKIPQSVINFTILQLKLYQMQ